MIFASQANYAFALTQAEITTAALNTFTTKAATFDWSTYHNDFLNGIPDDPNTPANEYIQQYDAGPLFGWGESYLAMTQRAMFEATGDTQYFDLLLDGAEFMYDHRSDRLNPPLLDIVRNNTLRPAFINFRYNPGTQHAWLVHSAFASHPVTFVIDTINNDPQLQATYGARADALTADVIQTMDSFDADFDPNGGGCVGCGEYYLPYLDLASPHTDGHSPYNMQDAAGLTYIGLWKATGEQRFYDRAVSLANTLKNAFTLVGNRYEWDYAPYNSPVSDISHAGLDVNFAIEAYEAGIVFDETDIERLANTMRHIESNNAFAWRLDGVQGAIDYTYVAWLWLRLTRYDAALREEMYPVFQDYWDWADANPADATAKPLFALLGSALLYETGQYHTLPGDFNGDGMVDAADYIVWRKSDGTTEGYNAWRSGFGASNGGGAGSDAVSKVAVPEPPVFLCALIGAAAKCCTLLRRRT